MRPRALRLVLGILGLALAIFGVAIYRSSLPGHTSSVSFVRNGRELADGPPERYRPPFVALGAAVVGIALLGFAAWPRRSGTLFTLASLGYAAFWLGICIIAFRSRYASISPWLGVGLALLGAAWFYALLRLRERLKSRGPPPGASAAPR